jgi:hypothetical protein
MNSIDELRQLAASMRHSAGTYMVPGYDGNKVANLIESALAYSAPKWQDIATAPKDGPILAYNPVQGVYATRYDRGEWPHADWYSDDLGRDASLWYPRPTHWQPLPSAPLSASPEDTK